MKVHIVYGYTPYEGEETLAVFLSEANAKKYIQEGHAKKKAEDRWETYDVYSMTVEDCTEEDASK